MGKGTDPAEGERAAVIGFAGQYELAARIVRAKLATLEWIRVADPAAGIADDFQFKAGPTRHAVQVKWSQYPSSFPWSGLVNGTKDSPSLLTKLAQAWQGLRSTWTGPLTIHLRTNNYPSTATPASGTPLAAASVEGPRHFAAFLARSFEPVRKHIIQGITQWDQLVQKPEVEQWSAAWSALKRASCLNEDHFVVFIRDLEISFAPPADDTLLRPDDNLAESELGTLAWTLQSIVGDAARPVQLSRDELLERLGWTDRLRYRHPHRFPVPALYTANEAARAALEKRLSALAGGYVALVGPAGSGKSTLLASLNLPGTVVRYFAFVPDAPDPLSGRGESESFLHDVSLALDAGGLRRSGYGNDLRTQRSVLYDQLDQAGRRWNERGESTIVIVDGLDHIPREQSPSRSLLEELPAPGALSDGVFFLLGTQTTQILPETVQAALSQQDRTVDLPPLSAKEAEQISDNAGLGAWLGPAQKETLIKASEGHPLALTYLLQELSALERSESTESDRQLRAETILSDASIYGRDIELRYRGYFRAVSDDPQVLTILGVVARLRTGLDLDWLADWADAQAVESFTERAGTFFHRNGTKWQFIHNSFRRFLSDETARFAGRFDSERDRQMHIKLAEVCAQTGDSWPFYKHEELAHRFLAGQYERVLDVATPSRLRTALLELRPLSMVRDHALLGLRAAAAVNNYSAYLRMLLFNKELWQSEQVLEPEKLATSVLAFEPSTIAMEHVVRGGRLNVSVPAAAEHAAGFAAHGDVDATRYVMEAYGGLAGLLENERLSSHNGCPEAVADWAEATWHLSGLENVLTQLDHFLPLPADISSNDDAGVAPGPESTANHDEEPLRKNLRRENQDEEAAVTACRNLAHARCFDLLSQVRDDDGMSLLTSIIDAEATVDWQARARVVRAMVALEDGSSIDVLRWVAELTTIGQSTSHVIDYDDEELFIQQSSPTPIPASLRIQAAELLIRAGFADAPEIDRLVPMDARPVWSSVTTDDNGLAPFQTLLALQRVRAVRCSELPVVADWAQTKGQLGSDAGNTRFKEALVLLSRLEGQHLAAAATGRGEPPVIAAHADPIIRILEVPQEQTHDWTGWYRVRRAAPDLFRRLIRFTRKAEGTDGLNKLLRHFDTAWITAERAGFWTVEMQQAVITAALETEPGTADWANGWLEQVNVVVDERTFDPQSRAEAWLAQANAWAKSGDEKRARDAAKSAVRASLGSGFHDDDQQLTEWLEWLSAAFDAGVVSSERLIQELRRYASRIVEAADQASNDAENAAEHLIDIAFPLDATLACGLAESFCDEGVLKEEAAIQAVVLAAVRDNSIPVMLAATTAAHLLMPISRVPAPAIADAVRVRDADNSATALLTQSAEVWTVKDDSAKAGNGPQGSDDDSLQFDEDLISTPETPGALLTAMRAAVTHGSLQESADWWDAAVERIANGPVSPMVARALLEQADRLRLGSAAIGRLAELAARMGHVEEAVRALVDALARTPRYGWYRYTDGGSRLKIFEAALQSRIPELVRLAAQDLAGAIAIGSLSWQMATSDLLRIARLIGGTHVVAEAWPDISEYLDFFAPAGRPVPAVAGSEGISATEALIEWVAGYLGHPIRPLDFGARRVLQVSLRTNPLAAERTLAAVIGSGGWAAEAALLALVTTPSDERPRQLSAELSAAVAATVGGPDAICRDIALRLARRYKIQVEAPPRRPLPTSYQLALPPLRRRSAPELDAEGTPHLDVHDPQHLVAPYDLLLKRIAQSSDIDPSAVLHRAAALALDSNERWVQGGHRSLTARLKARGQRHSYRPWAYMAGRRALGNILAELLDSGELGTPPLYPAYACGLVDEVLVSITPRPVKDGTFWRREKTPRYSVSGWCEEVAEAAQVYATAAAEGPYVLAESSEWRGLEWGRPEEERRIVARQRGATSPLLLPLQQGWEVTWEGAHRYPRRLDLDWPYEELVVHGYENSTDARWLQWLALHPKVAARLGWEPDPDEVFAWRGTDGELRAKTICRARGQLSHQAPASAACAEIWQVVLTDTGRDELLTVYPGTTRRLELTRTLPANRRESRLEDEQASAYVTLTETL